jgi:hypothetical protein
VTQIESSKVFLSQSDHPLLPNSVKEIKESVPFDEDDDGEELFHIEDTPLFEWQASSPKVKLVQTPRSPIL